MNYIFELYFLFGYLYFLEIIFIVYLSDFVEMIFVKMIIFNLVVGKKKCIVILKFFLYVI